MVPVAPYKGKQSSKEETEESRLAKRPWHNKDGAYQGEGPEEDVLYYSMRGFLKMSKTQSCMTSQKNHRQNLYWDSISAEAISSDGNRPSHSTSGGLYTTPMGGYEWRFFSSPSSSADLLCAIFLMSKAFFFFNTPLYGSHSCNLYLDKASKV